MPERHTGQNKTDKLMEIADNSGISENISVIVHHQTSNTEALQAYWKVSKGGRE